MVFHEACKHCCEWPEEPTETPDLDILRCMLNEPRRCAHIYGSPTVYVTEGVGKTGRGDSPLC